MDKEKMNIKNIIIISVILLNLTAISEGREKGETAFNYQKIIRDEFVIKVGSVIPITIWQSIETDGTLTNDGQYLFFTSDREKGNFDIYLRYINDITTVRITEHASKDSNPAVSPDGKYLAFVSQREDPEGDIFIIKLDPEKIIIEAEESVSGVSSLDSDAQNLTLYQDPETKTIRIIKDASPCWSPDGEHIAFSSTRDGMENIWIMDRNGKDLVQITKKGGMYPCFSNDGEKIIFISYRDEKTSGDILTVDIDSLKETRITNTQGIEIYPAFLKNDNEIVYTLIDRDTNNDKKIDLKDNSVLYYKNLSNNLEYQLTLYSESSFFPKWSSALNGIIIYSNLVGENINVNMIPESGIIPKKQNAKLQFDLSEKYIREYDDIERYLLSLEDVYNFFGKKADIESRIYTSKALGEAAKMHISLQNKKEAARMQSLLSKISKNDMDYSSIISRYIDHLLEGKPGELIITEAISQLKEDKKNEQVLPFLLEDLGDELSRSKKDDAIRIYTEIIDEYPDYKRLMYVHYKLASLAYIRLQKDLSPSYLEVISSGYLYLRIDAIKDMLRIFDDENDLNKRIEITRTMFEKYKDIRYTPELFLYIIGKAYLEKGDIANAKSNLMEALKLSRKLTYMYYKINILLGQIAEREKNYIDMEKFLSEGANKYERRYKEEQHINIIRTLIDYYEEYGERAESAGDYAKAVELYQGYVNLLRYLRVIKIYPDIYNEYSSRAHILYIDAYSEWKGNDYNELKKLEYEYNEKNNMLAQARVGLDKAHIYGLAYIYTKMAYTGFDIPASGDINVYRNKLESLLLNFKNAAEQIEWALFMDDTFIDPEILKGWIYQYVDLMRQEDNESGGRNSNLFNKYFPEYLWEKNISSYGKALETNDESQYPEKEGNLHLNIANTYFLLSNYPRAFNHYKESQKYKKYFSSRIQEALFYYHLGYCYWQNDELANAREEMRKTMFIYESMASGNYQKYKYQIYYLYRFFALFDRIDKNYDKAIAWYNRIIELSKQYDIKIDLARYMQEIAYCYKEMGETEAALGYLERADNLLDNYEVIEKDYSLKASLLGLFQFNILNLGPDPYTVGNNRIYSDLDTIQKKLLNASLKEEIYYKSGELQDAIKSMEKKLQILGSRKTKIYNETRVRTLNNIGFYYFKLRDYEKAGDFFKQAWDFAADPDINDLEGVFVSIQNTINLYSFMLENNISGIIEPKDKIDSLIRQIAEYRESYEKNRYDEEMKKLEEKAKAQDREVREEEIDDIKEKISEEAKEKYYTLDIAIGVLEYQKAELLRNELAADFKSEKKPDEKVEEAYKFYSSEKEIFSLYSDAIKRFENAINKAEARKSRRLVVKLLLDLGKCQEKTGMLEEAYNTYLSALNNASSYEYEDLLWAVYQRIAEFLAEYGEEVETNAYLSLAQEYYDNAVKIIEEYPYLYSGEANRIKSLYDNYSRLLAKTNDQARALKVSEAGYEVLRIMLTGLTSPKFYSKEDNDAYKEYIKQVKDIESLRLDLSKSLETGEDPNSVLILKENLKGKNSEFRNFINDIKKRKPLFASFISLPGEEIPMYDNTTIYKFIDSGKGYYAWKIDSGKVQFKEFTVTGDKKDLSDQITSFMNDDNTNNYRFVVLNDAARMLFQKRISREGLKPFMYVPSIERVKYYMSTSNINIEDVINNKSENEKGLSDAFSPAFFFQNRMEPALIILNVNNYDMDYISMIIESSLYSGIKTLLLYNNTDIKDPVGLTAQASLKPLDIIALENTNILGIGFKGYDPEEREKIITGFKEEELRKFQEILETGDLNGAELYLNKWHKINPDPQDNPAYFFNMAEIELLRGNLAESISYTDKVIASSKESSDIYNKAVSNKIFLLLYKADFAGAEGMLNSALYKNFTMTQDFIIYRSILSLIRGEKLASEEDLKKINNEGSILPKNKLKLLFAEYLDLFNKEDIINTVLEDWNRDYITTEREILKIAMLKNKTYKEFLFTQRAKESISIRNSAVENLKNKALLLSLKDGKYDDISIYPVYYAVKNFLKNRRSDLAVDIVSEIDIRKIKENALWLDSIKFLSIINQVYEDNERYDNALSTVREINDFLKILGLSSLLKEYQYKEAIYLSKLESHNDSYNLCLEGAALVKPDEDLYIKYKLLLIEEALYIGKIQDAVNKINEIESKISNNEYKYVLYFLKSRIEFLKILEKGKASESGWAVPVNLILSALEALDSSPDVISRYNRIDLINEGLDFLISYKMSRGDAAGSLLFVEVKKQINLRSKYPNLISVKDLPEESLNRFKAIKDKRDSNEFVDLLKTNPALQFGALVKILPLDLFQNQIQADSVALYLVANAKDILGWIISHDSIKTIRIKNGFVNLSKIIKEYDDISIMRNTSKISKELYNLFKILEKYYKEKNNIIIITDDSLEQVPFEIIGERDMLEESYNIVYLSSILSSFKKYNPIEGKVHFVKVDSPGLIYKIESISVKESGIPFDYSPANSGIAHINSEILFDSFNSEMYIIGEPYKDLINTGAVYVPDYNVYNMSLNDFAIINSLNGIKGAVINNAGIHDLNNAFFVDAFYRGLHKAGLLNAFQLAKESLRKDKRFSSPAYWAGIRLYLNGI